MEIMVGVSIIISDSCSLKAMLTKLPVIVDGHLRMMIFFTYVILLHEKFLQFDWLRAAVFQLNLKYLHVKITNLLRVVV